MKNKTKFLFLLVACFALFGCGGGGSAANTTSGCEGGLGSSKFGVCNFG